jgi:5-formyltetrahydrofolate cyclo-ligase
VTTADSKARIRAAVRAARAARDADDRAAAAEAIAGQAMSLLAALPGTSPRDLSAYLSLPTEPGTDALLAAALSAGHRVRVPRITGRDLQWASLRTDTHLVAGPLGIREPVGPALDPDELAGLDLMLVPGLAVDRSGRRLGQGGGYYDRVLASVPSHAEGGPMLVAVLYDDEVLDEVPYEAHDCTVDAVVTPGGIILLRS